MKRAISQDDWKRTQLRMPQHEYDCVMQYAEKNKISINTAMLNLIEKGMSAKDDEPTDSNPLKGASTDELMAELSNRFDALGLEFALLRLPKLH